MYVRVRLLDSFSLKDKRRVMKGVIDRVSSRFNVSVSEVDDLDVYDFGSFGFAYVSNGDDRVFDQILLLMERDFLLEIIELERVRL